MPIYSFRAMEDDEFVGPVHEEFIQLSDETPAPPVSIVVNGVTMHRDVVSDMRGFTHQGEKEYASESMAFSPEDIPQAWAQARKDGVDHLIKDIRPDGVPVFKSARDKERYAKNEGYHQKNSYY